MCKKKVSGLWWRLRFLSEEMGFFVPAPIFPVILNESCQTENVDQNRNLNSLFYLITWKLNTGDIFKWRSRPSWRDSKNLFFFFLFFSFNNFFLLFFFLFFCFMTFLRVFILTRHFFFFFFFSQLNGVLLLSFFAVTNRSLLFSLQFFLFFANCYSLYFSIAIHCFLPSFFFLIDLFLYCSVIHSDILFFRFALVFLFFVFDSFAHLLSERLSTRASELTSRQRVPFSLSAPHFSLLSKLNLLNLERFILCND